jgi:3-dehydrotetronate 4-kinase
LLPSIHIIIQVTTTSQDQSALPGRRLEARMPAWGCIADDITGATDLATNFVSRGLRTSVFFGVPDDSVPADDLDVVIVALKSRTAPVAQAVTESLAALAWLTSRGSERIYVKYCSTFDSTPRGNIGPVIDAVLAETGVPATIVVPSFPATGRTVYEGHLFVGDQLLDESPMRNHPLTPMLDSDVARLLRPQTSGNVVNVTLPVVRQGADALADELASFAELGADGRRVSIVIDAIDDDDLTTIMSAARGFGVVTGGSGLALGVTVREADDARAIPVVTGRRAVLCGSASARTREQIAFAQASLPSRKLDLGSLRSDFPAAIDSVVDWARGAWSADDDAVPLVYSVGSDADLQTTAEPLGEPTGELVERALAEVAARLVDEGVRRLIVAGGESSGRVMQSLGVTALRIGPEIAPGVAWSFGTGSAGYGLDVALKSGNFGDVDMFTSAWAALDAPSDSTTKGNLP